MKKVLTVVLVGFLDLVKSFRKDTSNTGDDDESINRTSFFRKKRLILIIPVFLVIIFIVGSILHGILDKTSNSSKNNGFFNSQMETSGLPPAIQAGKHLSNNQCEGEGVRYKLGRSPMDPEDFSIVIPYGLMIDSHVTPIDHQYFSPKDYKSAPDTYEVYAMGDAWITNIEVRSRNDRNREIYSIRLVFTVTCTYFYYYDLLTSLTPDIQKEYESARTGLIKRPLKIKVKEGQLIGRIGAQTLDFAVWDTTKPLSGFVIPEHYTLAEPWKIYTADPLDYYTNDLKRFIQSRYVRTVEPISGKIDYDIDGKIIGNWFLEGTVDYKGGRESTAWEYWKGHFAIAPDHFDPEGVVVSFGNFQGQEAQFLVRNLRIRPESADINTGLIRYELVHPSYIKPDGGLWDGNSPVSGGIKIIPEIQPIGHCVLLQLVENRKLKVEYFANTNCSTNLTFTSNAKYYLR